MVNQISSTFPPYFGEDHPYQKIYPDSPIFFCMILHRQPAIGAVKLAPSSSRNDFNWK